MSTRSATPLAITIIASQYPFSGRVPLVPPILEYLAALTLREQPDAEITLLDANQQDISPNAIKTDIVAISAMTATVSWAYRFADGCRKRGIRVVLGGIHPTALPEEAVLHADTVVVGEAESVWGEALADMRAGRPKKFYYGERLPLANLPQPINGKLKGNYQFRAFFTMRGCPYRCSFCSVRKFFGDTIRYRPIPEVAAEIEACAGNIWFNGDDNIWGGDLKRSTELFTELAKGKKRSWYGFGDLRSLQTPEGERMLKAARESGLFSVWVGWESDDAHLRAFNATGKQGRDRVAAVKMMQDAGIDVTLFVVLGGRQDSLDSFKRTLDLSEKMNVGVHPVLLTPLPGTELYKEYRDHLIPGLGWDSYVGVKAVFEHPLPEMTPVRRELEYHHLCQEHFRFKNIAKRISAIPLSAFPKTHLLSFMTQMPMKLAFSKAYDEWKLNAQQALAENAVAGSAFAGDKAPVAGTAASEGKGIPGWMAGIHEKAWKSISFRIFGLCLVLMTVIHFLHTSASGVMSSLDRADMLFDIAEEIVFRVMVLTAISLFIARQFTIAKWHRTVSRIARDKINRWSLAIREIAYSSMLGAGVYWAYICMADLL